VNTVLVSACTPGYLDCAGRLAASAHRYHLSVELTEYESTGDWVANGHIKPTVIMRAMLASGRRRPVAWVDADAEFTGNPSGLDAVTGCDVAVSRTSEKEILSGTVLFLPTPGAMWVLCAWEDECRASSVIWDQMALAKVINSRRAPVKVADLHPSYCYIPGATVLKKGEPIVTHHQASREVRAGTRQM